MDDEVYTKSNSSKTRQDGSDSGTTTSPARPQPKARSQGRSQGRKRKGLAGFGRFGKFSLPKIGFGEGGQGTSATPGLPPMPGFPAMPSMPGMPGMPGMSGLSDMFGGGDDTAESGSDDSSTKGDKTSSDSSAAEAPVQGSGKQSALGLKSLKTAQSQLGVQEAPPKSNRGPEVDLYTGAKAQPWCAHFVSWCVEQHGTSPFGHKAAVSQIRDWAKSKNKYIAVGGEAPLAGDVFTMARYDKTGKLVGGHIGFVESYDAGNTSIVTVEGNTSDKVKRGHYALDVLDGFVRL